MRATIYILIGLVLGCTLTSGVEHIKVTSLVQTGLDFNLYVQHDSNLTLDYINCSFVNIFKYISVNNKTYFYDHLFCNFIKLDEYYYANRGSIINDGEVPVYISEWNYSGTGNGFEIGPRISPFFRQTYYVKVNYVSYYYYIFEGKKGRDYFLELDTSNLYTDNFNITTLILELQLKIAYPFKYD